MDIFYYWKDIESDLKAGRLGYFRSSRAKLAEFQAAIPDNIWVFKTPKGRKGEIQLLAKLRWSDKPTGAIRISSTETCIFYDAEHPDSVSFIDSGSESALYACTNWVRRHFPSSLRGNMQGELGQQELRGTSLFELNALASSLKSTSFGELTLGCG